MALLDTSLWDGRIFASGWREAAGGTRAVVEPATGKQLATVGLADASDVARAAAAAKSAQSDWAATDFQERAAILRRAGEIIEANADEIHWWIVREAGSILPKAQLKTHVAAQECFEAAALPSRPFGQLLPASSRASASSAAYRPG